MKKWTKYFFNLENQQNKQLLFQDMYAYLFTHVIYLLALHIWVARSYMYYTCSYYSIARFWFVKVQYDISCEPHEASWCVISLPMVIQLNFCNHESTLDFHSYPANCIIFYYNNLCIILYYLFIFIFFITLLSSTSPWWMFFMMWQSDINNWHSRVLCWLVRQFVGLAHYCLFHVPLLQLSEIILVRYRIWDL